MAKKARISKAEREAAAAYARFEKWSDEHEGFSKNVPVLGKIVWANGDWSCKKRVPVLGKTARITISEGLAPSEYELDQPPRAIGGWAGKVWSSFCDEWPAERRVDAYEVLHNFVRKTADSWLRRPDIADDLELSALIQKHRDSIAHFKNGLALSDVYMCNNGRRRYVMLGFDAEFDEEHGLNLFYVLGRKKLIATFGDQLGPD